MEFFIEVRAEKRRMMQRMTKGQLVRAMKDLDDDARIRVFCTSSEMDVGAFAYDIYPDDIEPNAITIVAHF